MDRVRTDKPRRRRRRASGSGNGASIRTAAAVGILLLWGASTAWDIFSLTYDPPEGINTVALAAATYLFGSAFFKENQ